MKFTIIDLSSNDINKGFDYLNEDIEDNIHFSLSQKKKCDVIITNNTKDFVFFTNVSAIKPKLNIITRKIK